MTLSTTGVPALEIKITQANWRVRKLPLPYRCDNFLSEIQGIHCDDETPVTVTRELFVQLHHEQTDRLWGRSSVHTYAEYILELYDLVRCAQSLLKSVLFQ